jgi:tRNA(Ile)-lysidine synthase TilS/MesJ
MVNLALPIAAPPWTALGKKLESSFRKALIQFDLLENASKVAVALSGGKDSLTLLYLLKAVSGRGFPPLDIHAIHVAGEVSCGAGVRGDYLKAICDALEIPYHVRESEQTLEGLECYRCSRERRTLIFDCAKELGIDHVAFGHHRDDSIQTLMLNLLVKGEFAGNLPKVPMHAYGVTIIRPLILMSEKDITSFAQSYGFQRVSCQCPVGQNSKRKEVETLLQQIEYSFPHARSNLAQAVHLYGSDKALRR